MNRTLKILLSCLIGSGIGTFIALSVNSWFWWTGALAGGLIGYLSYDFKNVVKTIPRAWRATVNWKPNWQYWISVPLYFMLFNMLALNVWIILYALGGRIMYPDRFLYCVIVFEVIALCLSFFRLKLDVLEIYSNRDIAISIAFWSPLGISVGILCGIGLGFLYVLTVIIERSLGGILKIPAATVAVGRFFKKLFLLIHSEVRLLCAVDSMFGVIAGYLISHAYSLNLLAGVLVGMIAGALLGLAQYRILSVWILQLAPKNGD